MEIDGKIYTALPGDIFFYGPGIIHTFHADILDPYLLTGIHFDFTDHNINCLYPIGPFNLQFYKEELITENIEFMDFIGFPERSHLHSDSKIRGIIFDMLHDYENGRIYSREYINGLFRTFLTIIARGILLDKYELDSKPEIIDSVMEFIQEHYAENLTNESIADKFHFHRNYLNSIMVAHTGVSLRQYLIDFRIRKALDMLLNTRSSITEISETVGFKDLHYFSRLFKKKTGLTPIQVRAGRC